MVAHSDGPLDVDKAAALLDTFLPVGEAVQPPVEDCHAYLNVRKVAIH